MDSPLRLNKDNEKYFLMLVKKANKYQSNVWIWDPLPGEIHKGLPLYLPQYKEQFESIGDALKFFKSEGFKLIHPYHKIPKWLGGELFMANLMANLSERLTLN